jgi:gamma-glutamyltranspeptidase/glutathione hydrolase
MFRKEWPTSAALYLPGNAPPAAGKLFRNPGLAATYKRVLAESEAGGGSREARIDRARDAWYRGFVAEAVEAFCRKDKIFDSSGRRHHGVLAADDMARWQAPVEEPVGYDYRGYTVLKGGPWGQGPVLLQQLALLSGFDLDDTDPTGAEFVHTVTECAKLAYADREAWYGDPDFVDVPMQTLLSQEYNDARRKLVGDRASLDLRPGSPDGRGPYVPAPGKKVAAMAGVGEPTVGELAGIGEPTVGPLGAVAGDTCHLDIIDRWGNMVSATPSGGWLQSSPVIPALGFCLGSRLQISWLDEKSQSSLEPGKRPRSTLSPQGRRAVHGLWHAGRRRPGPMVDPAFPASRPSRDEPAGGDRLPRIQYGSRAELVLSARRRARLADTRRPHARGDPPRARRQGTPRLGR